MNSLRNWTRKYCFLKSSRTFVVMLLKRGSRGWPPLKPQGTTAKALCASHWATSSGSCLIKEGQTSLPVEAPRAFLVIFSARKGDSTYSVQLLPSALAIFLIQWQGHETEGVRRVCWDVQVMGVRSVVFLLSTAPQLIYRECGGVLCISNRTDVNEVEAAAWWLC